MKGTDHYHTMEIKRTASGDEIKRAYRKLARRFHPDVSDDPNGETKFKALAEAYQTLKQADSRAAYDSRTSTASAHYEEMVVFATWQAWVALFVYPGWPRFCGFWRADSCTGM